MRNSPRLSLNPRITRRLDNQGFTLLEVMIAASLLGFGLLAITQVSQVSMMSGKRANSAVQYQNIYSTINAWISSGSLCSMAFLGQPVDIHGGLTEDRDFFSDWIQPQSSLYR